MPTFFFLVVLGGGGGGAPPISVSLCNNNNNRDIDYLLMLPLLMLPSLTNFGYYSTHEFHSSEGNQSTICPRAFSSLHPIRSLAANFDAFHQMLSDMNNSFSIIGLSETKIKFGMDPYINTDLLGYCFLSQLSMFNAGGVGFYIKNNVSYAIRDELCCALFFSQLFPFTVFTLLYQEHNKDCCCCRCCFFKTGDFVFKTPACFAIWFGLSILSYKVSCKERSSFALLTTISSEMHQWQSFLYHALASAQFFTIII